MSDQPIRIGVLGCGHWGPNHLRVFSQLPEARVVRGADLSPRRLESARARFPAIEFTQDPASVIEGEDIDAIVIATPTATHFEVVRSALLAGKDVLCEKPLALRASECERLAALAEERGRVLMVGHIFLFNPGIRMLRDLVASGEIGRLYYIQASRTNLGPIRTDVNVVYDLIIHDLSILRHVLDASPTQVSATGHRFLGSAREDVVFATLWYADGTVCETHASWLNPRKVRRITAVGERRMVTWDDLSMAGQICIYDKGVIRNEACPDFGEYTLSVREGEMRLPHIPTTEPLREECLHFLRCVRTRACPLTDAWASIDIVEAAEAICRSIESNGKPVSLAAPTPRSREERAPARIREKAPAEEGVLV